MARGKHGRFVSYLRVSTDRQGRSGLGLEAQREAVAGYLGGNGWELVAEHVEVESGKRNDRPELAKALAACRVYDATLVVARLDRLARDAHFLLGLKEAGVDFVCCDMPAANRLTVGIMAMVAEEEGRMISARTKAALAAARARGVKLGTPANLKHGDLGRARSAEARSAAATARARDLAPVVEELRAAGATGLRALARGLNDRNVPAPRGGAWHAAQVRHLLRRLGDGS